MLEKFLILLERLVIAVENIAVTLDTSPFASGEKAEPESSFMLEVIVTEKVANLRRIKGFNNAPKEKGGPFPIMEIAEDENGNRIQAYLNEVLDVNKQIVQSDGGLECYQLLFTGANELFVRKQDVKVK